jgi:hypothetical protein
MDSSQALASAGLSRPACLDRAGTDTTLRLNLHIALWCKLTPAASGGLFNKGTATNLCLFVPKRVVDVRAGCKVIANDQGDWNPSSWGESQGPGEPFSLRSLPLPWPVLRPPMLQRVHARRC